MQYCRLWRVLYDSTAFVKPFIVIIQAELRRNENLGKGWSSNDCVAKNLFILEGIGRFNEAQNVLIQMREQIHELPALVHQLIFEN